MDQLVGRFVGGPLRRGIDWGGPACRAAISTQTHARETAAWLLVCGILYFVLSIGTSLSELWRGAVRVSSKRRGFRISIPERAVDGLVLTLIAIIYVQLVFDKFLDSSLIYLLQPCHLLLFIDAAAIMMDLPLSIVLQVLTLPYLTGTLLAVFLPATSGLSEREIVLYYLEHYLLNLAPFWLLCRRDFSALELCSSRSVLAGTWIFLFVQWTFFEPLALLSEVNIQFMLCPTQSMQGLFSELPAVLLQPSYRFFIISSVGPTCIVGSFVYILISRVAKAAIRTSVAIGKES